MEIKKNIFFLEDLTMKLFLNGKMTEPIKVDNFNRNLNISSKDILFDIYFSTNDLNDALSFSSLIQYATTPITEYVLSTDENEVVLNAENINAKLISFGETFSNENYTASAAIQELKPQG